MHAGSKPPSTANRRSNDSFEHGQATASTVTARTSLHLAVHLEQVPNMRWRSPHNHAIAPGGGHPTGRSGQVVKLWCHNYSLRMPEAPPLTPVNADAVLAERVARAWMALAEGHFAAARSHGEIGTEEEESK
jgi:hypothetical protein